MKSNKIIILVGDGMGDLPLAELNNRTPLEAARTPAMDELCRHGILGQLKTIPDGFPPGSDVANLSLLGYRPEQFYTGRSPLEAASMGVELEPDEVAFRCNLVNLDFAKDGTITMVDYSAGHISSAEARELIISLDKQLTDEKIKLYPGISYRHLLVYKGEIKNLGTVPPHDYTGQKVDNFWQHYLDSPQLKKFISDSLALLADHPVNRQRSAAGKLPANGIWLWGEGKAPEITTLSKKYGISSALISAVDLLKGIGVYAGMDVIEVEGATGYLDTNYSGKVDAALEAIKSNDLVFVHVEAPDETGHQGLLAEKIQAIEDFDQKIVKPIVTGLGQEEFRLVVCMDHFTPISLRTHSDFPIPFVFYDSTEKMDSNKEYNEKNGKQSELFLADGEEFFKYILK
jgi:2,3-bisphosphoglycerate-independent phosphoglycerate mutase